MVSGGESFGYNKKINTMSSRFSSIHVLIRVVLCVCSVETTPVNAVMRTEKIPLVTTDPGYSAQPIIMVNVNIAILSSNPHGLEQPVILQNSALNLSLHIPTVQ